MVNAGPVHKTSNMRVFTGLILCFIFLSGCKATLKSSYGIKKPQIENDKSIRSYLFKQGLDTSSVLVFKSLPAFIEASDKEFLNIPDAMFFNKNGDFIPYRESTSNCNANVDKFITDLKTIEKVQADKSKKMDVVLNLITLPDNQKIEKSEINVFITWATYAGKLNREKAFEWVQLLDTAKKEGVDVNYYLLNCDFQESWNMPLEVQEKLGIKK